MGFRFIKKQVARSHNAAGQFTYTVNGALLRGGSSVAEFTYIISPEENRRGAAVFSTVAGWSTNNVTQMANQVARHLKMQLETLPAADFSTLRYKLQNSAPRQFIYNSNCSPGTPNETREAVAQSLDVLGPIMQRYNLTRTGSPIVVEESRSEADGRVCFQAGIPFSGTRPRLFAGAAVGNTPSRLTISIPYVGPEENLPSAYDKLDALVAAARLARGKSFEIYNDDPQRPSQQVNREIHYQISGDINRLTSVSRGHRDDRTDHPISASTSHRKKRKRTLKKRAVLRSRNWSDSMM